MSEIQEHQLPSAYLEACYTKQPSNMSDDEITNQQASWNLLRHRKHQRAGIFVDICDFIPPMEYKMYDFLTGRNVTTWFKELGS